MDAVDCFNWRDPRAVPTHHRRLERLEEEQASRSCSVIDHRFVISWELTAYNTVTQAEYGTELCFELMRLVQFLSVWWTLGRSCRRHHDELAANRWGLKIVCFRIEIGSKSMCCGDFQGNHFRLLAIEIPVNGVWFRRSSSRTSEIVSI